MTKNPEEFYSKGAEQFAEKYSLEQMPQSYIDMLDKFADQVQGKKVLDAGCGHGRDTQYLVQKGFDATGVDLAEGMIEHAKNNKEGNFHMMDVSDLKFNDEEFDGVWCNTVMHFFKPENMPEVLNELKRVLKPSGTLYITFKIGEGVFFRERYDSEVKQYLISEEKAEKMLKGKNFQIKETQKVEVENTEIMNILAEHKP